MRGDDALGEEFATLDFVADPDGGRVGQLDGRLLMVGDLDDLPIAADAIDYDGLCARQSQLKELFALFDVVAIALENSDIFGERKRLALGGLIDQNSILGDDGEAIAGARSSMGLEAVESCSPLTILSPTFTERRAP
jgi:hypothetical protein